MQHAAPLCAMYGLGPEQPNRDNLLLESPVQVSRYYALLLGALLLPSQYVGYVDDGVPGGGAGSQAGVQLPHYRSGRNVMLSRFDFVPRRVETSQAEALA